MYSLFSWQKWLLAIFSALLVAFGQPAWSWITGLAAAVFGYALFFRVLLAFPKASHRFWIATGWYTFIEIIQLSWLISHPYSYIYAVLILFSFLLGLQFGILALLIQPKSFSRLIFLAAIASLWTVFEWSRLFFFSGFSWNPAGLSLTGAIYPLQFASLWGVFGLSFLVMWVNLLAIRLWIMPRKLQSTALFVLFALLPYAYGVVHYTVHEKAMEKSPNDPLSVLLVQPSFPIEESFNFRDAEELRAYVLAEWRQVLSIMKKQMGKSLDLIILPEYMVPYGTYFPIFTKDEVHKTLKEELNLSNLDMLPVAKEPIAGIVDTPNGKALLLSNAYWVQALSNIFKSAVIVGLEDVYYGPNGERECYNAAFYFRPQEEVIQRYEKRVLVPMGEYIPLEVCRKLAAKYGISGSFTCGKEAKVFSGKVPFSTSICYEEMFGDLMREGRGKGAELLVNITSDAWFPNSRLPQQHFDHARLRTVENGIALVRACNTGVTGAVDSLGRIIAVLEDKEKGFEWKSDSLHVNVPTYHYYTLYSFWGDKFILIFSAVMMATALFIFFKTKKQ